ncbi:hypothetical protein ACJMK2_034304, partial [Sinanodonta woodiana]
VKTKFTATSKTEACKSQKKQHDSTNKERSKTVGNYRKDAKEQFRMAECDHVNNVSHEGISEKNPNPFWK